MDKKLYKSNENKMILGVCGGIGEYFNVDPTIIRLLWVFLTIGTFFFIGTIGYIAAGLIIPSNPNY